MDKSTAMMVKGWLAERNGDVDALADWMSKTLLMSLKEAHLKIKRATKVAA